jgi:hypothetical protein
VFDLSGLLCKVIYGCGYYCQRDKEFDPPGSKMHQADGAERKGNGMSDRECSYQDHYLPPVFHEIAQAEGSHEKDVIHGFPGEDMA